MAARIEMLGSALLFVTALMVVIRVTLSFFQKKPAPLPPGPKGLPILGNVLDLPLRGERECDHWLKHKDIYGPISSITALGQTIVILHSPELAVELLEKRSLKYGTRPPLAFAESVGWTQSLPIMPYNDTYRARRKLMHTMMGTKAIVAPYLALQTAEVHRFLFRVLRQPESLVNHIKTEAAAIILKIVYGYTVDPHKPDPLVELVDEAMEQFSAAVVPGAWLVDVMPVLKYIPDWLPGGRWKRTSREWHAVLKETSEKPLQFAQQRMARGNKDKNFVTKFYEGKEDIVTGWDNDNIKWSALTTYGGGADTTVNAISSFFLAMTLFPEVQLKAREEIDRVVGTDRLPSFNDRENLPYIEAVLKEAWRWHTVAPISGPHTTTVEDFVNGYRIPKGAIVLPNVWWFTHDPAIYPDPMIFNPSRYLGSNPEPNPTGHIFGYGRRICAGRYIADSTVWLTIARSLAVFEIGKGLDESGREIEPIVNPLPGIISRPDEFQTTIKPRSHQHEALIRQVEELHPWEESDAAELQKIVI
ncbi:cytochrome protein [Xylaria venustula]|nr:cytochrome protein [Xylaria venustula]